MVKYYLRSGLSSIRTHTSRKSSDNTPRHELLMQLTSLEIEMTRRATERAASMKRIDSIDQRMAAIADEQQSIRQLLGLIETSPKQAVDPSTNSLNSNRGCQDGGVFNY